MTSRRNLRASSSSCLSIAYERSLSFPLGVCVTDSDEEETQPIGEERARRARAEKEEERSAAWARDESRKRKAGGGGPRRGESLAEGGKEGRGGSRGP